VLQGPRIPHLARLLDLRGQHLSSRVAGRWVEYVDWGYYQPEPWRNYLHRHSYFEVCYAYAGQARFRVDERDYDIGAGTVFVARPGAVHEIVPSARDPLGIAFWGMTLGAGTGERDWLDGFESGTHSPVSVDVEAVDGLVRLLARAAADPLDAGRGRIGLLAAALAAETVRSFAVDVPETARGITDGVESADLVVRTMRRYLRDNLHAAMHVRDVAAQVHLSERHAARLFQAATGESVLGYHRRLRLEHAASRLLGSDTSIESIAAECGFTDRRHFTRCFRQRFGISPSDYRASDGTVHDPAQTGQVDAIR
jgi:AraC-like DNA-binding protein